jgi:L-aspartate oxidase
VDRLERWFYAVRAAPPQSTARDSLQRLASVVTVGLLVARAARRREESRGGHFRADFPSRDDIHWRKHVSDVLTRD